MHVIAGFESQIAAHGGVRAIAKAVRSDGVAVGGAALVRVDSERGVHVDPVRGFELPAHVLRVVDGVVGAAEGSPTLGRGQTALVVALVDAAIADPSQLLARLDLAAHGALWVASA